MISNLYDIDEIEEIKLNKNGRPVRICKGFNSRLCPCKNKVRFGNGEYCNFHKNQKPIEFYPVVDNWPSTMAINARDYLFSDITDVCIQMKYFQESKDERIQNNIHSKLIRDYENRICAISMIELIKTNRYICYNNEGMQGVVRSLCVKFHGWSVFEPYIEDFKRKCLKSHRDQARKKLIWFYFQRNEDLYYDICEKIMEFY